MEAIPSFESRLSCTRRHFITASAALAASGAVLGAPEPAAAVATGNRPAPLPPNPALGGLSLQIPPKDKGDDPATVYNFQGLVGRALAQGVGSSTVGNVFYNVDFGFAQGKYISTAGASLQGTFMFC